MRRPWSRSPAPLSWALVDPSLTTPELTEPFANLLALARSGWSADLATDITIDVEDPFTRSLLSRHRVSTAVPLQSVPQHQRERFRDRLANIYGVQLRLEATTSEVLSIFDDAGIETRVLKGLASAGLDYPSRELRQTGDIDLAVRDDQFNASIAALSKQGYTHHETGNSVYLLKGETLDAPNGIEIDLHTRLVPRSPRSDILFNQPGDALVDIGGSALPLAHRLAHAASHFILTPPGVRRFSGLVDVTCMRENPALDLTETQVFAKAIGVEPLVGAALGLESTLAGRGEADLAMLDSWPRPGFVDRETRLRPERNLVLDHANRFREVPPADWLAYLPSWLVPDQRLRKKFVDSMRTRRGR